MSPYRQWSLRIEQAEDLHDIEYCLKGIAEDHELADTSRQTLQMACDLRAHALRHQHPEIPTPGRDAKAAGTGAETEASSRDKELPAAAKLPARDIMGENMESIEGERAKAGTKVEVVSSGIGDETLRAGLAAHKAQMPDPEMDRELALIPDAVLDTPQKLKHVADLAIAQYEQFERVKAAVLREGRDYVFICSTHRPSRDSPYKIGLHGIAPPLCTAGHIHVKIGGADKLGSLFAVRTTRDQEELLYEKPDGSGKLVRAKYVHTSRWNGRTASKVGVCEMSEVYEKTEHNCMTKAESRSRRRAILAVLGGADAEADADPIADEE